MQFWILFVMWVISAGLIPRQTNRVHLGHGMDQWEGDSPRAIRWTARHRRRGQRYIDINFQTCLDDIMGLHSRTAAENGYRYIKKRGLPGRRLMTPEELHRDLDAWPSSSIVRWRRTLRRGVSYESRVHPYRFRYLVRLARLLFVTICAEVKSRQFAKEPRWAKQMRREADAVRATVYPMALMSMKGWGQKAQNFDAAGMEFALLLHGCRKVPALKVYEPYISAYWGGFGKGHTASPTV